jgi:hypothetical protein
MGKMLVAYFNAVKVESVPLNFNILTVPLCNTPGRCINSHTSNSQAGSMTFRARGCGAALALVAGLAVAMSAPAQAASDEDQIRAVLASMNNAYNGSDFSEFASHLCTDMLQTAGFAAGWYSSRGTDGPTRITVNSIAVRNDPPTLAVANVRFEAANHEDAKTLDIGLVRENKEWKACKYSPGRTV